MAFVSTARHRATWLTLASIAVSSAALFPAHPLYAQTTKQAAKSMLTGIALKDTLSLTSGDELAAFRKQLDALAANADRKRGTDETLIWTAPAYTGISSAPAIMDDVAAQMKKAGYEYKTQALNLDSGQGTLVVAGKDAQSTLIGFWLKSDQLLVLSWCRLESSLPAKTTTKPSTSTPSTMVLPADNSAVLVAGNPPLTKQMVEHTSQFLAYLLEAPLTVAQKATIEEHMVDEWQKKVPDTISMVADFVQYRAQIFPKPDAERDFIRKQLQPKLLETLRADKSDAGAKWLLDIYNSSHVALAPGSPPLTRQMTDAYTEVFYFMASEVIGQKNTPTLAAKNAMAKTLAAGYAKAPAASKKTLTQMPLLWAAIRVIWTRLPESDKNTYREQWAKDFATRLPASAKTAAANKSTRQAVPAKSSPQSGKSSRSSMAAIMAMQQSYQMQNQMMWQNHYSRMNTIANLGPSPYRYVNAYGNPY